MMLKESRDTAIHDNPPEVKTGKKWKAEEEVEQAISALEHRDIVGATQCDRNGLGMKPFKPFPSMFRGERRSVVWNEIKSMESERRELHLIQCSQQGQMTRWVENVIERKIGWTEIWKWSTSRLSFLLRAAYDVIAISSKTCPLEDTGR